MASSSRISLLYSCLLLHYLLLVKCEGSPATELYVFGDSMVDSGNNNFLNTQAKVNYMPYGIDFTFGVTGRATNGETIADFIAQSLGLPFAPAYLSLSDDDKSRITTGVNYASGSSGILPETGSALGKNLHLDEQIKCFQETVTKDLLKVFETPSQLSQYLSKSIFLIVSGSNDYGNNYLQPRNYNASSIYTPREFAQLLIQTLKQRLKKLYSLGARKLVVFDVAPLGCLPAITSSNAFTTTTCVENVNEMVSIYNAILPSVLHDLELTLPCSTFVRGDLYGIIYDMNQNPTKYGLRAGRAPCCAAGPSGTCLPGRRPCEDRTEHLFWDAVHPTQQIYSRIANSCIAGSSLCVPINIQQLAKKP